MGSIYSCTLLSWLGAVAWLRLCFSPFRSVELLSLPSFRLGVFFRDPVLFFCLRPGRVFRVRRLLFLVVLAVFLVFLCSEGPRYYWHPLTPPFIVLPHPTDRSAGHLLWTVVVVVFVYSFCLFLFLALSFSLVLRLVSRAITIIIIIKD